MFTGSVFWIQEADVIKCASGSEGKKFYQNYIYSETCLKRTPLERIFLSALDRL